MMPQKGSWRGFLGWFFALGIFPVVLAWPLGSFFITREMRIRDNEAGAAWQQELLRIAYRNEARETLGRAFRSFFRDLERGPITVNRCREAVNRASRAWNFPFEAAVFDGNGEPIILPELPCRDPAMIRLGWNLYTRGYRESRKLVALWGNGAWGDRLLDRFGSFFFHPFAIFSYLERTVFPMRFPDRDGWMMWWRWREQGKAGGMILVERPPSFRQILDDWLAQAHFQGSYLRVSSQEEEWVASIARPLPDRVASKGIQAFETGNAEHFVLEGQLWGAARLGSLTVIGARNHDYVLASTVQSMFGIFLAMYLLGIYLLLHPRIGFLTSFRLQIRGKIGFLMAFTLFPPLTILLLLGHQKVRQAGEELTLQVEKAAMETLQAIDKGFLAEKPRLLERFRKIRDDAELRRTTGTALRKAASRLLVRERLIIFEIRDLANRILWTTNFTYPFLMQGYKETLEQGMKQWIPHRLPQERLRKAGSIRSLLSAGGSAEGKRSGRFLNRDRLNEFQFGPLNAFMYTWFYPEPSHPFGALVLVAHADRVMIDYFERQAARRFTFGDGQFRILARYRKSGQWLGQSSLVGRDLRHLAWVARNRGLFSSGPVRVRGRQYLGMVLPGGSLSELDLVALFPRKMIEERILPWHRVLRVLPLFSIALMILLSWLLSRQLLTPVGQLARALVEIGERKEKVRVNLVSLDELGELGRLFDETFAKLGELDLARAIQEGLFPPPSYREGTFQVRARIRAGSGLSGQFIDILPLGGGNVLLAIGAVSGSGASAALVMAMVKSAIKMASEEERDLACLHELLAGLVDGRLKGAHTVACFLGLFDTSNGEFTYANAGNPSPLVIGKDGAARRLAAADSPLGSEQSGRRAVATDRLKSGEALVLSTSAGILSASLAAISHDSTGMKSVSGNDGTVSLDLLQDRLMHLTGAGSPNSKSTADADFALLLVKNG